MIALFMSYHVHYFVSLFLSGNKKICT